jgi:hypothetical protein
MAPLAPPAHVANPLRGAFLGWHAILIGGLTLAALVATLKAIHKPLWFDELFTLLIARLESPREIVRALEVPLDAMPPPYYMICSATLRMVRDEHVGCRLPSICGYLAALAGVYTFLAVRVDRLSALAGAAFLACTVLADYAYEARPYALLVGSVCWAACAWQRVDRSPVWAVALAAALGLAVSCHYHAVFVWPAFAFAEAIVLATERRLRVRVWLALAVGIVPFVVCWPLLAHFREVFGRTWGPPPRFALVLTAPQMLLKWNGGMWAPAAMAALAAVCIGWIFQAASRRRLPASPGFPPSPLRPAECALAVGLLAIPIVAVTAARLTGGGMAERYMMPMLVGAAVAVAALVSTCPTVFRVLALSSLLAGYAIAERPVLAAWSQGRLLDTRVGIGRVFDEHAAALGDGAAPIVITDGVHFVQLAHYCSPDTRARTWAVADRAAALALAPNKSDVVDRSLLAVAPYVPLHIAAYDEFLAEHDSFFLCATTAATEWLPIRLLEDGHTLTLVNRTHWATVHRVTVNRR